ncbi:hypothetical protein [Azospirillum aestuarii]|uniref:hypothetical protein n=1 Tax=Azospirillum aestuarii TaxID=2802052 RepID=UPI004054BD8D
MHIDLDALEAKARAAKAVWPGPWRVVSSRPGSLADGVMSGVGRSKCGVPKAVAEHMAASGPDTVLMLIHTIKEWR